LLAKGYCARWWPCSACSDADVKYSGTMLADVHCTIDNERWKGFDAAIAILLWPLSAAAAVVFGL